MIFFFQAEDGIRDGHVTGVQTCALPIYEKVKPRRKPNPNKKTWNCAGENRPCGVEEKGMREFSRGGSPHHCTWQSIIKYKALFLISLTINVAALVSTPFVGLPLCLKCRGRRHLPAPKLPSPRPPSRR